MNLNLFGPIFNNSITYQQPSSYFQTSFVQYIGYEHEQKQVAGRWLLAFRMVYNSRYVLIIASVLQNALTIDQLELHPESARQCMMTFTRQTEISQKMIWRFWILCVRSLQFQIQDKQNNWQILSNIAGFYTKQRYIVVSLSILKMK